MKAVLVVKNGIEINDVEIPKPKSNEVLVKVFAWYDNEWGFSCRMLDTAVAMMNAK